MKELMSNKIFKKLNKYLNSSSNSTEDKNIRYIDEIKVAFISDQFTYDSFKYEFEIIEISPDNWLTKFKDEKPDLFFCESAWDGHNFEGMYGPWHEKIFKDYRVDKENRGVLFEILDYFYIC